jgi:hypothetical protein
VPIAKEFRNPSNESSGLQLWPKIGFVLTYLAGRRRSSIHRFLTETIKRAHLLVNFGNLDVAICHIPPD